MKYIAAPALVLGLALSVACGGGQPQAGPQQGQGFPPVPVKLADVAETPLEDATEYVATLKSLRSTTIQPQIDGQITQIFVKSGDHVSQGERLLQIDPRRQEAAVSTQEAQRQAAEASVAFARQQAQRSTELYNAGAISKQELEQAQTALRTAEASLQALQAQVQQQQVQLRYFTVSAPTSGIVGDVPVRVGMQVSTLTVLTTIDENDTLEVNLSVPVERGPSLKIGLPLEVLTSDGTQKLATTTIDFISPHVDETTQSILAKGNVRNPGGSLRSLQFVRARIVWRTSSGVVVPVTSVLRINGQYFVFVADNASGKLVARQRPVQVGAIVGDTYPVLEGLKVGDRVVVSGVQRLVDGAPLAPEAPAQAPEPRALSPKP